MRARILGLCVLLPLAVVTTACSERDEAQTEATVRDAGAQVQEAAEGAADVVEEAAGTAGEKLEGAARDVRAEIRGDAPDTASTPTDTVRR